MLSSPKHICKYVDKGRGNTSYLSSTVCDEVVSIMGKRVLEKSLLESRALVTSPYQWTRRLTSLTWISLRVIRYVLLSGHGQSYDNASSVNGKYNGMQAIVLEKCQSATFISCAAHSLNLVDKCAAEC